MLAALKDRHDVITQVLHAGHLAHLWTPTGPTPEARRIRDAGENVQERTWVRLAFALYDGSGGLTVAELFDSLEQTSLTIALTQLFRISLGEDSIEALLDEDVAGESPPDSFN